MRSPSGPAHRNRSDPAQDLAFGTVPGNALPAVFCRLDRVLQQPPSAGA